MKEYHKIQSLFKRDMENKGRILIGEYSRPEFEFLKNCQWHFTEKIDGMNIRVMLKDGQVSFAGKSDNASLHPDLFKYLQSTFTAEKLIAAIPDCPEVCLYGEGYGAGIQKGGKYRADKSFILFDVKIGEWWLGWESVLDISQKLGIDIVPDLQCGTLDDLVTRVKAGVKSFFGDFEAEGIVAKPKTVLFNNKKERIITKLKTCDFVER